MNEILSGEALAALFQVIMIDLVLAGDNAIIIGLAAAGLPADQRKKASSSASLQRPGCVSSSH
jgi:predicted tellurium resistance membrane protein TerC